MDYMIFVDKVRKYSQKQTLEDAVEQMIRECMEEDAMADFLKRNRGEVVKMCLYEYDEEKQHEFDREEGREEGRMELLEELVRKKLKKGYSKEAIADSLEIDSDTVETIISAIIKSK